PPRLQLGNPYPGGKKLSKEVIAYCHYKFINSMKKRGESVSYVTRKGEVRLRHGVVDFFSDDFGCFLCRCLQ
ncbi:MAG: hypothetical protein R6T98_04490, partial [Desulfatiglandales bacterium]